MSGPDFKVATTFLFSDIEGSTRRWEGDPEAMATDLARHDALLRAAVRDAGGRIFSHTGDGMGAAFDTPVAAVAAAVAAQQALDGESWAGTAPLRVRMGLHTGPAHERDGNYFGPALNRAARLMGVGAGGQVLCTQSTVDLMAANVSGEVDLVDLGEHRLADLARPERVFQIRHPKLQSEFPPLRSLGAHRHNLPVALSPFVGRTLELKKVGQLLEASRLVTLTGVGGAGKTRLALQTAADAVERYRDGVWLVELTSVSDGALVGHTVARSVGIDISGLGGAEAVAERLVSHLATRETLLLVDNCEHLVAPTAGLIHALLSGCPGVRVLATSRETLGLPGEVVWPVPPLSLPPLGSSDPVDLVMSDAMTLFCERAWAARPDFQLTEANTADVTRICRRLDGIPLALELAAAQIRVLSPRQVADRLDAGSPVLTSEARTASPRHQTLRATLDWSYDLLSPAEQATLRQLAVFPASFPFDAVAAVVGRDALDLLSALVDKSLVVTSDDGETSRYRLLEPVRQYGWERLIDAGEEPLASRRHRDYCLSLVARWEGQFSPPERILRLASEEESFHAALEWSWSHNDILSSLRLVGALWHRWMFDGTPWVPEWLERVVGGTSHLDHPARVESLCGLALTLLHRDPGRAMVLFKEAAGLAEKIGHTVAAAGLDFKASEPVLASGDTARARLLLENALARFESLADEPGIGACHDHLGWVAVAEGDHQEARLHFERAAELAASQHHDVLGAEALASLAALEALAGEAERGLRLADEAVMASRRVPIRFILVNALLRAAETALLASQPDRAVEFLVELLEALSNLGTERYLGDCLELVALTQARLGNPEAAAEIFGAAAARHEAHNETSSARFLAGDAHTCRLRLSEALGPDRFAHHLAHGRALSADAAIARALAGLQTNRSREATGFEPAGSGSDPYVVDKGGESRL